MVDIFYTGQKPILSTLIMIGNVETDISAFLEIFSEQ